MFFNYKIASVWSPPEVLSNPKKIPELNWYMDVYSFGMILWEIWHNSVPFDNDISQASNYVINEDSRPKILMCSNDNDSEDEEEEEEKKQKDNMNSKI